MAGTGEWHGLKSVVYYPQDRCLRLRYGSSNVDDPDETSDETFDLGFEVYWGLDGPKCVRRRGQHVVDIISEGELTRITRSTAATKVR